MSNDTRYNGWTNYETWCVKLWIDNDQGTQELVAEMARLTLKNPPASEVLSLAERAAQSLAGLLREKYETAMQNILERQRLESSVWADLLGAALGEVNWDEIATVFVESAEAELSE